MIEPSPHIVHLLGKIAGKGHFHGEQHGCLPGGGQQIYSVPIDTICPKADQKKPIKGAVKLPGGKQSLTPRSA
jgi:hypothetical protein